MSVSVSVSVHISTKAIGNYLLVVCNIFVSEMESAYYILLLLCAVVKGCGSLIMALGTS